MKYMLFSIFSFFLFTCSNVYSTSTSFEQSFILSDKSKISLNSSPTSSNIQSIAIVSYLGIFSKKLYENGFFSPFGLLPDQIKNLSPLAYKNKTNLNFGFQLKDWCERKIKRKNQNEIEFKNIKADEICNESKKIDSSLSYKKLIYRYSE